MSSRSARPSAPATRLAASTGAQRGAVATLHVATWNPRHGRGPHGGVDLGAIAARIAAMDADVVAVQEVDRRQRRSGNADQIGELAHRLGWHGQFAATIVAGARGMRAAVTHDADDGGPAYGIGLLSRHPLNAPTTLVLPPANADEPRVLLRAAVSTAAGDVGVGVTHLSWKPGRPGNSFARSSPRPGTATVPRCSLGTSTCPTSCWLSPRTTPAGVPSAAAQRSRLSTGPAARPHPDPWRTPDRRPRRPGRHQRSPRAPRRHRHRRSPPNADRR